MSKDKISDFDATAANNTDVAGVNIAENCPMSGWNNAVRALMAILKATLAGTSGDKWPITAGGTGAGTAADARTNLGLGDLATMDLADIATASETISAGEDLADRDLIYQDIFNQRSGGATKWYKIDTDATGPVKISPRVGIALAAITSGNTGSAQVRSGRVSGFVGLTAGQAVYASTTAGGVTQTEPAIPSTGTQNAKRLIGVAASTTEIDFNPNSDTVFTARDSALASGGTLVVEHFTDSGARERVPMAYLVAGTSQQVVSGATGTAGGNMSGGGGNAAGFDGTTAQGSTSGARTASNGVTPHLGKDWGSGNTKTISGFVIYSPNNDRLQNSGTDKSITATLYGSNAGINSGGVSLGTLSITDNVTSGTSYSKLSGLTTTTAYRYHWVELTEAGGFSGAQVAIAELVFYENATVYDEPISPVPESLNSSSTNDVTVRFADASNANADTKTTFRNRTNATRDMAAEVVV